MANSPNNGLINETNEQYYVGHQARVADTGTAYTYTFNEDNLLGFYLDMVPLAGLEPASP